MTDNRKKITKVLLIATACFFLFAAAVFLCRAAVNSSRRVRLEKALQTGDIQEAERLVGKYGPDLVEDCEKELEYLKADKLLEDGMPDEALILFLSLGSYRDCAERAGQISVQLNPSGDESGSSLALYSGNRKKSIIDTGFYHTVAVTSSGNVLACGDNSYGQCDVSAWSNVTDVAAGAYHTLALKDDGTVLSAGRNLEGQCDVSEWRDIVAVAAADYASFGLKSDGTVVYCGYNDYYMLPGWTSVVSITAGSYSVAGIRADGTALISHVTARSDELTELTDLALNTGYSVGVKSDGSVVSSYYDLSGWKNIVSVSASSTAIIGVDVDGDVHSLFFFGKPADLSGIDGVVTVSAGGTHFAFVLEDGSVIVRGDNSCGQCDTESWELFGE